MKVLVIGGTGYIGSHAVEELARRGHEVSALARGATPATLPTNVSVVRGDRHNPQDLAHARSLGFEAVVDINSYAREETQLVINTFQGTLSRFVHLSSIAVCQGTSGIPLVESDPLVTDPSASYAYGKAECERALRWAYTKSAFPFVSVRPTAVFGPRDRISRENYYLRRIVAGDPVIVPDSGDYPVPIIYVKDLASVLANALTAEGVAGAAYHVSQPELVSIDDHIAHIARLAGVEPDIARIPSRLLERLGFNADHFPFPEKLYSGCKMIVCDTEAARRDLRFQPTPYLRALSETVGYFMDRGPETQPARDDALPVVMPRSRERALVKRYRAALAELEDRLTDEWLNEAITGL